ncbi:N-acetyltransferase [Hafnia alvei]|nr:GNAT family protein [Hafnia alvei]NEY26723.1 GNAT family N-acetyltransferase [Escherichia coli]TBL37893.1 N-acetyltransferase [Hafnia alvei]STQ71716.1 Spermidine N(1)-acetyltransferase [Hafnia alvei]
MVMLETQRLIMRQITESDWAFFSDLYRDEQAMALIADTQTEQQILAAFESRLPAWRKELPQWLCLVMIDRDSGQRVGLTGFVSEWMPHRIAEVGFIISPRFQRKGYGKESLTALIDFAFSQCGYHKLKAVVTSGNEASRGLLMRSGFQQEGCLRQNYFLQGKWHDDWVFGLLAEEYSRGEPLL